MLWQCYQTLWYSLRANIIFGGFPYKKNTFLGLNILTGAIYIWQIELLGVDSFVLQPYTGFLKCRISRSCKTIVYCINTFTTHVWESKKGYILTTDTFFHIFTLRSILIKSCITNRTLSSNSAYHHYFSRGCQVKGP